MNQRNLIFAIVTVLGLALDQATKIWVVQNIQEGVGEIKVIPGFFSIVHRQNPGAAFGFLQSFEYRHVVFLIFTALAGIVILDLFRKLPKNDRYMSATLGLILSGAIGNAIDRVHKQTVTDFLKVYTESPALSDWLVSTFGTNEWPSFNVADSALVVGVILYIFHQLFLEERNPEPGKDAASKGAASKDAPEVSS